MNMWNIDSSTLEDLQSPLDIVSDQCKELSKLFNERVIARVTEYDGPYRSTEYNGLYNSEALSQAAQAMAETLSQITYSKFDVQEVMGDNITGDDYSNRFVYELFLTSKNTPKYKYRVFFMYYGIGMYPVGLTIQGDIAKEIGFDSEGMQFENTQAFEDALAKILSSATLGKVVKNLAALNPMVF